MFEIQRALCVVAINLFSTLKEKNLAFKPHKQKITKTKESANECYPIPKGFRRWFRDCPISWISKWKGCLLDQETARIHRLPGHFKIWDPVG